MTDCLTTQVVARELRRLTAAVCEWMTDSSLMRGRIRPREEKLSLKRGFDIADAEASGLQFPIHELVAREPSPSSSCFPI